MLKYVHVEQLLCKVLWCEHNSSLNWFCWNSLKGTSQIILGLNNRLAALQSHYDQARAEALHGETAFSNVKNTVAEMCLEIDQVRSWGCRLGDFTQ
jgi:hypothetical protein